MVWIFENFGFHHRLRFQFLIDFSFSKKKLFRRTSVKRLHPKQTRKHIVNCTRTHRHESISYQNYILQKFREEKGTPNTEANRQEDKGEKNKRKIPTLSSMVRNK